MTIADNIGQIRDEIGEAAVRSGRRLSDIMIVAVTKKRGVDEIAEAAWSGIVHFGENRVQEAAAKLKQLADCRQAFKLHFIGHLQSNKARNAIAIADIMHSVDTLRLARLINEAATRKVPVLIQVNLAGEESKYGFAGDELDSAVRSILALPNLDTLGLMAIAPQVDDVQELRPLFTKLRLLSQSYGFRELSMGMSDDFDVAIEEGSTMIRVGRAIFGERS